VLSGRAQERGGGTSAGVTADAFISLHGVPVSPFALSATPRDVSAATLAGLIAPRLVRRLVDGRHSLFVRARDAVGNWGPVRSVVLPVDRTAPAVRASGLRHGDSVTAQLHVAERGSGLLTLRYRVELGGRGGRWHALRPAAQVRVTLHARRGRRAILRVWAVDVVGNVTRAGFVLPR
jgi:hypothetical protein